MSNMTASISGVETRQSMIRVWLAISAVWVAFWLCMAAIAMEFSYPLAAGLRPFSIIVILPPVALLGMGVICRWVFAGFARAAQAKAQAR